MNKTYKKCSRMRRKNYRWLLFVISEWFVWNQIDFLTIRVECGNFLNFYGRYVLNSVWVVFNNFLLIGTIDRSKISSDQKRLFFAVSLYPFSFFANTPFKCSYIFNHKSSKLSKLFQRVLVVESFPKLNIKNLHSTIKNITICD